MNKVVNKLNNNNNGIGNKISSIQLTKKQFIYQKKFIKKQIEVQLLKKFIY